MSTIRDGPEDRPAHLDAVLGFVGGVGRGDEVVLADGAVDARFAGHDVHTDGGVGAVELAKRSTVDGYGELGGGNLDDPGPGSGSTALGTG